MNVSDVIAIIAIIVSIATAIVTIYIQFFYKKEEVYINLANYEGYLKSEIKLLFVIHNRGNQNISITNCFINFSDMNEETVSSGYLINFEPFVLNGKEQRILEISDFAPQLDTNKQELFLNVSTVYVNANGNSLIDIFNIGRISVQNQIVLENQIQYTPHKLDGAQKIMSL